jgi:hypothetical protein
MANPFYTSNNPSTNLKDIYNLLSNSNNPRLIFENLANNNPNLKPILNLLNNGYSPEQVFNMMCEKKGIDPNEFIQKLKQGNNISF